jgi:hypothetical protein
MQAEQIDLDSNVFPNRDLSAVEVVWFWNYPNLNSFSSVKFSILFFYINRENARAMLNCGILNGDRSVVRRSITPKFISLKVR